MQIDNKEFSIPTEKKLQVIDITDSVKELIKEKQINNGLAVISTKHTTTAIRINENEPRLIDDIQRHLEELAPQNKQYLHDDIDRRDCPKDEPLNAHAHLKAMLMGASESLPIISGELNLGQWQKIFFVELDGPRARKYVVTIIGE